MTIADALTLLLSGAVGYAAGWARYRVVARRARIAVRLVGRVRRRLVKRRERVRYVGGGVIGFRV